MQQIVIDEKPRISGTTPSVPNRRRMWALPVPIDAQQVDHPRVVLRDDDVALLADEANGPLPDRIDVDEERAPRVEIVRMVAHPLAHAEHQPFLGAREHDPDVEMLGRVVR